MRSWRMLSLALGIAALVLLGAAAVWLGAQGAPIAFAETYENGSAADFAGVTLAPGYHLGTLRWDLSYSPGTAKAETRTHCTVFPVPMGDSTPQIFQIQPVWAMMEYAPGTEEYSDETAARLQALFDNACAKADPAADSHTERIQAADWFDEVPFGCEASIPGWDSAAVKQAVLDAVRMPLQENPALILDVYRGAGGKWSHAVLRPETDTTYYDTPAVIGEDTIWFALTRSGEDEAAMDASLLPGGNGLWRIRRDAMTVEAFCPLPEGAAVDHLFRTKDGARLLMVTNEGGTETLRVVDAQTGAALQTLPLPLDSGEALWDAEQTGDALLLRTSQDRLLLLAPETDGSFALALTGDVGGSAWYGPYHQAVWDGNRLVIAGLDDGNWFDLRVTVFRPDGTRADLTAECSLTKDNEQRSDALEPILPRDAAAEIRLEAAP